MKWLNYFFWNAPEVVELNENSAREIQNFDFKFKAFTSFYAGCNFRLFFVLNLLFNLFVFMLLYIEGESKMIMTMSFLLMRWTFLCLCLCLCLFLCLFHLWFFLFSFCTVFLEILKSDLPGCPHFLHGRWIGRSGRSDRSDRFGEVR